MIATATQNPTYRLSGTLPGSLGYWALAFLTAALYTYLTYITPLLLDDWVYLGIWRDDAANTDYSPAAFVRYAELVRKFDNGRIPNITAPLEFLVSPTKELFPLATGLMMAFTLVMVQRFATGKRNVLWLSATWALTIAALPWADTLLANIYAYNYIWTGFITLLFLWYLRRCETSGWNGRRLALCALLAVIAGGWHEAFSAATLCGLGLLVLVRKFRLSPRFFVIFAVYLVSTVIFMLSPGMLNRMAANLDNEIFLPKRWYAIAFLPAFTVVTMLFSRKGREILKEALRADTTIICAGIIVSGYIIAAVSAHTPRSAYWPSLASVALFLYLFSRLMPVLRRPVVIVGATGISCLCTAQTIAVIYWQQKYTKDWENVMTRLDRSANGTVYYDSPNPAYAPPYTLGIPISNSWRSPWHFYCLGTYYMKPVLGVVPSALEDFEFENAVPLKGSPEAWKYKGHIVSRTDSAAATPAYGLRPGFRQVNLTFPDGSKIESVPLVAVPFITARGDTLMYYTQY